MTKFHLPVLKGGKGDAMESMEKKEKEKCEDQISIYNVFSHYFTNTNNKHLRKRGRE